MIMPVADDARRDNRAAPAGRRRPLAWSVATLVLLVPAGFGWFVSQLHSEEQKPARHADGIVVFTGGSSRVSDALDLLAEGYGKRLLISGVHPTNGTADILRKLPDSKAQLACCVDLGHAAINTRSNAAETRRWASERGFRSLIVVTSTYHMPRASVELSHAMPEIDLIFYPVVSDAWREEPWWTSAAGVRLVLTEYVKFVAAEVRVRLADLGLDLMPENDNQPAGKEASRKRATPERDQQKWNPVLRPVAL